MIVGKDLRRAAAFAIQPINILIAPQENAPEEQGLYSVGVIDGVHQSQGTAPGASTDNPVFYTQVFAHKLNIIHQLPGSIFFKRSMRLRAASTALIKQNNAIAIGVKKTPVRRRTTTSRTTVQINHRDTVGIT